MFSKIILQSEWYFVATCIVLALATSIVLYRRNIKQKEISKSVLYVLFLLRFLSLSLSFLLLLNIVLKQFKNETEKPLVIVAIDNSNSMMLAKDSQEVKNSLRNKIKQIEEQINQKYETKIISFGSQTFNSKSELNFSEKETDLSTLFEDIENNYSNQNIGAMVLVSDGIYNKGTHPNASISKLKFPIYSIATGDTTEYKDVFIQKVLSNEINFLGNSSLIEVTIGAKKVVNQKATVSLVNNNQLLQSKEVLISKDDYVSEINFTVNPQQKGLQHYTVKISPLNSECNFNNNQREFEIEVIDNKEKIALISNAPHPDFAAIKQSIESKTNYSLETFNANSFTNSVKEYGLIILHSYNSSNKKLIEECRKNNVPFWILNPDNVENLPGIKINLAYNKFTEMESFANEKFSLFSISAPLKKFISQAPALKTFVGNYTTINSSNVLLKQKIRDINTENAVLLFNEFNDNKTATFIGDGLWRWRMRNFIENKNYELFDELIGKTIQYLIVKKDKSFFRLKIPNKINENQSIEIEAEVYNKSYELTNLEEVTLTLTDGDSHTFNYTFNKKSNYYNLGLGLLKPGKYIYKASTKMNNEIYTRDGSFLVNKIDLEKMNLVANHKVLYQICKQSNGEFFYLNQTDSVIAKILKNENIKSITYTETKESFLIELKWLFALLLLLLSCEWFIRKRYLTI